MAYFATRGIVLAALLLLTSCGGGGGSSNSAPSPPPASPPATGTVNLSPTYSLERESAVRTGASQSAVDAILDHTFTDQAVQSVVLLHKGYVIGERYSAGASADSLGTSWSVAKSFYAAAVGVAIGEGWINSVDQLASDFLTEWVGTAKENVTIREILEMDAGLRAETQVFFETDQTAYAISLAQERAAGSGFVYSNPTSQLMEPLLLRATGLDAHAYLRQKILTPIGIDTNQIGMWFDRSASNPVTYWGLDMRPDDFARFGLLFSRGGVWDGTQVVPASFVQQSLATQTPFYGFQWWVLNTAFFGSAVPINIVAALGLDGQKIYVWPEEDIVLVVLTQYSHSANAGYVLSDANFPDTCTARNSCTGATGPEVPGFSEQTLVNLLNDLPGS